MAITVVGTAQTAKGQNGNDATITFDGSPAEDDVVILIGGHSEILSGTGAAAPVTSGYTEIAHEGTSNMGVGAWYKVLGSTPDTTVVGGGVGHGDTACAYYSIVLRGVDTTTPVARSSMLGETEGDSTDAVNPPSVSVTEDDVVVAGGYVARNTDTPSGLTGYSEFAMISAVDTYRMVVGGGYKSITATGTEDPPAFTSWAPPSARYLNAISIVVSPASSGVTGSGTPAAGSATVAGVGVSESVGTGTPAAGAAVVAGVGVSESVGAGTPAASAAVVAGVGTVGGAITGAGTPTADAAVVAGVGVSESVGAGTPTAGSATVTGVGVSAWVGAGTPAAGAATVAGVGVTESVGVGTPAASAATVAGVGVSSSVGAGTPAASAAVVAGVGTTVSPAAFESIEVGVSSTFYVSMTARETLPMTIETTKTMTAEMETQ